MRRHMVTIMAACALWAGNASAQPATEVFPADVVRSELTTMFASLEAAHYDLFAHRTRGDYERFLANLTDTVDAPVSHQDLAVLTQRLAAYGRVGHARVDAPLQDAMMNLVQAAGSFRCSFGSTTAACC